MKRGNFIDTARMKLAAIRDKKHTDSEIEHLAELTADAIDEIMPLSLEIVIPTTGWDSMDNLFVNGVLIHDLEEKDLVQVMVHRGASSDAAAACGLLDTCESTNGTLVIFAEAVPNAEIYATAYITKTKG